MYLRPCKPLSTLFKGIQSLYPHLTFCQCFLFPNEESSWYSIHHMQEPSCFEAGWTPLLAAMVAPDPSHLRNAAALLGAAAHCGARGSGPRSPITSSARQHGRHVKCALKDSCAAAMVVAPNRFGQAALHLAARRGDCELLHLLLQSLVRYVAGVVILQLHLITC